MIHGCDFQEPQLRVRLFLSLAPSIEAARAVAVITTLGRAFGPLVTDQTTDQLYESWLRVGWLAGLRQLHALHTRIARILRHLGSERAGERPQNARSL